MVVSSLIVLHSTASNAAEAKLQLKSEKTALIMALDPIPGDALFFADKPVQGAISFLTGTLGAILLISGLAGSGCGAPGGGDCVDISSGLVVAGAMFYFPSIIWDGVGGMYGVKEHNKKVRKQSVSFMPQTTVTPNGGYVGLRIGF